MPSEDSKVRAIYFHAKAFNNFSQDTGLPTNEPSEPFTNGRASLTETSSASLTPLRTAASVTAP